MSALCLFRVAVLFVLAPLPFPAGAGVLSSLISAAALFLYSPEVFVIEFYVGLLPGLKAFPATEGEDHGQVILDMTHSRRDIIPEERTMTERYAIGIDLGGTNLRVALVSEEGRILKKVKKPSSDRIIDDLSESIAEIKGEAALAGIGIGVAGLVDRKNGRVFISPNLRAVEGKDLAREMEERFRIPVFIENDANAAALGERTGGAGREFEHFVLFTLGTGIGGGIIYQGRLLEVPAELGHMSINSEAEKCPCGNSGCLENFASARAMIAKAIFMLEKGTESLLKECCKGNIYKLTPEDIYKSALEGDALSREVLKDAGRYLGVGLANVINTIGPDAIILTGGLIGAWNIYVQEAIKEASRRAFKDLFDSVKIIPSALGDDSGIIGSASLVFMELSGDFARTASR